MNIRYFFYKLKNKFDLQFIKHSWLDLKRDKAKAAFGIVGIAISLFLLTTVGMLNDTVSYNYLLYVTSTTGSADIIITETVKSDLTFDSFYEESIIENDLQGIEGVEELFPRIMMLVRASTDKNNLSGSLQLYGIDFEKEYQNGHMGDLIIVDEEGKKTGQKYRDEPDDGECVILWNIAEALNISRGDTVLLEYQTYNVNLTVVEICVQDIKFMQFENALIIVNLRQAQIFLNRDDPYEINFIVGTIKNPKSVYDASDLAKTESKLRKISSNIQERLDINTFTVSLPKLTELEEGEFTLLGTTVIFWFIIIISMLITGILINSVLSTSVEERVREFGITRVVGGKKTYSIKIVLFEGLIMGIIGSLTGIISGIIFVQPITRALFNLYDFQFEFKDVVFIIQPQTILMIFGVGSLTSIGIALIPAYRTSKLDIIKSITPFQTKEEGWEVKKEGSMNVKSFLTGLAIATIGMIVFILLPNIFVTGEFMMIASLFIGLLAAILIGLVFASVGIIPLIQKLFLKIISPFIRKYYHIINISLKRYRRRNTSTIVMFAISFSFIFFITSVTEMESDNWALNLRFQYGSDLVLINQGLDAEDNAVTLEMVEELEDLPGIEDLTITMHNTIDIQAVLSVALEFSEGQVGFQPDSSEDVMTELFEFYLAQEERKSKTTVSDLNEHDFVEAGFIGVEEDFTDLIDEDLIIWKSDKSGTSYSFKELFEHNNTCIIAKSVASIIGVNEIGAKISINFFNPEDDIYDPETIGNRTEFRVVGISGGIPGFYNFRSSEASAMGGGVMVSMDNYLRLMKIENPREPNMIVDKVFINLVDSNEESIEKVKEDIRLSYSDKDFIIDDAISKINFIEATTERQSFLMEIILTFTVIISIFGLVSTMYAIMLERKFEIGILRSMGMKVRNVRNMFLVESMLIMLASGIMGTIIGTFTAYLLQTNMALFTEMPVVFDVPMDVLLTVFIVSISVGILFMFIILIKLSRQTIMDVFRESF
jgi:ABC-type antimicrobial peptide transport system permease subunit